MLLPISSLQVVDVEMYRDIISHSLALALVFIISQILILEY